MEPAEEEELLQEYGRLRTVMLESIMSVPQGRRMIMGPLEEMADGGIPERTMLDGGFWNLDRGMMPESRRSELAGLLRSLDGPYLNREAVRGLHLLWHMVEEMGRDLFSCLDRCRELIAVRNRMLSESGIDSEVLDLLATELDDIGAKVAERNYRAFMLQPWVSSVSNMLDLIEVTAGTGLLKLSDAAKRFDEALFSMRDLVERFVEANLALVLTIVKRFNPFDVMEEMDLVQEGCQGLMEAVRRFDPERGCKLSTFSVWWIRQHIMKSIIRHGRLVRLPVRMQSENSAIRRFVRDYATEFGREPTIEELASYMGMGREEIEEIYLSTAPPLSLDRTGTDSDATIADYLEGRLKPPDSLAADLDLRTRIETALESLSDREKTIITLRFGLLDNEPCTLAQLGRAMGISRERVRQIEARALIKLRNHGLLSEMGEWE
ncbi:MAG: hypothetical protein AVO35_05080 [Candidatus Aegiribacteria sp. MLS_C]|nr:MAG: hypothetical protein AVO35_05080 [Candidatus Aegiribacteria sp. MLS_C]